MNSIYLDTTTSSFLLAIKCNDRIECKKIVQAKRSAEILFPELENILNCLEIKLSDINRIYVTEGPGSYTGSRIGLTMAKTLMVINPKIEVYTTSSLLALSIGQISNNTIALIDARNDAFFALIKMSDVYQNSERIELATVKKYLDEGFRALVYEGDINSLALLEGYDVISVDVLSNMIDNESIYKRVLDYNDIKPVYLKGEGRWIG